MSDFSRFPYQIKTTRDAPEPFRRALLPTLPDDNPARLLIYTPRSESQRVTHGPLVLVVMDDGWICLEQTGPDTVISTVCDFTHTLLAELTGVLLSGRLKIVFARDGRPCSVVMELNAALSPALLPGASPGDSTRGLHSPAGAGLAGRRPNLTWETPQQAAGNVSVFNTVMERLYWSALRLLLGGMNQVAEGPPVNHLAEQALLEPLPLKFRNSVLSDLPPDEHLQLAGHRQGLQPLAATRTGPRGPAGPE